MHTGAGVIALIVQSIKCGKCGDALYASVEIILCKVAYYQDVI